MAKGISISRQSWWQGSLYCRFSRVHHNTEKAEREQKKNAEREQKKKAEREEKEKKVMLQMKLKRLEKTDREEERKRLKDERL